MAATERTLNARQGDTYKVGLTWKDSDGNPVDLTGADVEFGLAKRPGAATSFQYDTSDYLTLTPLQGQIDIEVPHTETRKWKFRRGSYEVTVTHSDGTRQTILYGPIKVQPEVVT